MELPGIVGIALWIMLGAAAGAAVRAVVPEHWRGVSGRVAVAILLLALTTAHLFEVRMQWHPNSCGPFASWQSCIVGNPLVNLRIGDPRLALLSAMVEPLRPARNPGLFELMLLTMMLVLVGGMAGVATKRAYARYNRSRRAARHQPDPFEPA